MLIDLKRKVVEPLPKEAQELTAIFVASRKTARNKDKTNLNP